MYKRIIGVLTGALVVTAVSLGYTSVNSLTEANAQAVEDRKSIERIIEAAAIAEEGTDYGRVEYVEKGDYEALDFTDVNEFLNSLQSLIRVDGADILYEYRVYDSSDQELMSLYESDNGNVSVAVDPDGIIEYCMFKNQDEATLDRITGLAEGSEYRIKLVNDGFILEQDETV